MLLVVAAAVIVLAVVVGAGVRFEFFDEFPSEWEWFFGILSIVGFIVGAIVFPQLIWGRPQLSWDFHVEHTEGERHLSVMLSNPQVANKTVRRLGVHRQTIASLIVQFRLLESGSGRILRPVQQALIKTDEDIDDMVKHRVSLPPTYSVGASAMIAMWDYENNRAVLAPAPLKSEFILPIGQYQS